jgi:uncharacterized protein (UPF0128 family)
MIKVNVKKDGKIVSKTFFEKSDLLTYLKSLKFFGVTEIFYENYSETIQEILCNKIWKLGVGSFIEHSNYIFSVRGKSPYHNTEHGKLMYGS